MAFWIICHVGFVAPDIFHSSLLNPSTAEAVAFDHTAEPSAIYDSKKIKSELDELEKDLMFQFALFTSVKVTQIDNTQSSMAKRQSLILEYSHGAETHAKKTVELLEKQQKIDDKEDDLSDVAEFRIAVQETAE